MEKSETVLMLQRHVRRWLAKRKAKKRKQDKQLDLALRQAYVEMVRRQRVIEDRRNKRLEDERKKKQEFNRYKKKVLEAAYDGNLAELQAIFSEVQSKEVQEEENSNNADDSADSRRTSLPKTQQQPIKRAVPDKFRRLAQSRRVRALVDCTDPNGNTPLSEAATGGNIEAIRYLISLEADPNSRGAFGRTPLWRASFCGHADAVEALLESGGDPRLYADDGQTPEQISANEAIRAVLQSWNVDQTDRMLNAINRIKAKHAAEVEELKRARCEQLDDQIDAAEREVQLRQQKTCSCQEAYTRRLKVVDTTPPSSDHFSVAKSALNDAELELESARIAVDNARGKLAALRLRRREVMSAAAAEEAKTATTKPSNEIRANLRELDEVLIRDIGGKLHKSDKWPLVIDPSSQAATFLRYRDTNYIHALHPYEMQPETIRLALLGAVRYGKPFIIDLLDYDSIFDTSVRVRFDEIMPNLLDKLVNKRSFLNDEVYLDLIRKKDGPEYDPNAFNEARIAGFSFIVVTSNALPPELLTNRFLPIRVLTEFSSFLDPTAASSTDGSSSEWL